MDEREKQAWNTILSVVDMLPESTAAYLQGYAQGQADAQKEKAKSEGR